MQDLSLRNCGAHSALYVFSPLSLNKDVVDKWSFVGGDNCFDPIRELKPRFRCKSGKV